ncbi:hypothetical protein K437DRAFT_256138 [Tilletiaria anomala UBC 951]|uniref:CHCH domain-containing protein n=1 Tax=Tilletiaria anomala (strain ATCC 24038 / CBS 436.72 / UBC 951) TaxID=1037660 RepID=A0A066VYQ1_TILAU|nr:uncharacterized protein K437DRAFT_256138 [Tilletiaria anomala UBC 951]KDN46631.1 hypothetical protein K437DRAFT_256138 [Tilletiaria anomala UBC 951]
MVSSCQPIRDDLAACLLASDCVVKEGNSPKDCLQSHLRDLPMDCQHLYKSYVECRRGLLDMRKRFRGMAPTPGRSNLAPGSTTNVETAASSGTDASQQVPP